MLNPGDVVRMKEGGCPMTVCEIQDGEAACVWFERCERGWHGPFRASIAIGLLEKVTESNG